MTVSHVEESGRFQVAFDVADTGVGIPVEKQRLIFDAFSQADGTTTRRYGGTGLGLTISAKLVELMGGSLTVDSELGRGSRFSVSLPFLPSPGETVAMQSPRKGVHRKASRWPPGCCVSCLPRTIA